MKVLKNLGLGDILNDSKEPRIKTGHARYSKRRSFKKNLLIVVGSNSRVESSGRNIAGVDVCTVYKLSVEKLAPGAMPRVVVWSASAISKLPEAISEIRPW